MGLTMELTNLIARQAEEGAQEPVPSCSTNNEYDGRMGVRISSIFVILVGSAFGAIFPVVAKRTGMTWIPDWTFFIAKYFGSGVIIATGFIHLLAPANEALGNECLTGAITEYPWPEGIALMSIFLMFFSELMTMRYARFGGSSAAHSHSESVALEGSKEVDQSSPTPAPGDDDHLNHSRKHRDPERGHVSESYSSQLTSIFILEFGVIFHSIFIGLTLAVSGDEFVTLYIVLVFHQTFEGLGLGSRLADVAWPETKKWTAYLLALGYGLSTPIAIAIGLGVRNSFSPDSRAALLSNGIFDSISAGILIYTGLMELMAHEFMYNAKMQEGPTSRLLSAFACMCLGAGLMSLLGKWA